MSSFVHDNGLQTNTMSELLRVYNAVKPDQYFGCYAYATQSGFRTFELRMGPDFWKATSSRWLFGFDYGRTDPRALREIDRRPNTEIRIFDGAWVTGQAAFWPRRDFHAKVAMMENTDTKTSGAVLGSGNFSYNGLLRSVEAGTSTLAKTEKALERQIRPLTTAFEAFWDAATPFGQVIDDYEARKAEQADKVDLLKPASQVTTPTAFWIEAGYVTKNRGEDNPGNQTFFPRGFRTYFNLPTKANEAKNSVLGSVKLVTSVGTPVTNNLRLNRNGMEKMSLPIPETHGFGVYDGKVLVFEPVGAAFRISALEAIEFEAVYGHRLVDIQRMNGGRRFGAII